MKKIVSGSVALVGFLLLYMLFWPVLVDRDLALVGFLLLYLLFWLILITSTAWKPPEPPELAGGYEPVVYLTTADNLPILAVCGTSYTDSTSRGANNDVPPPVESRLAGISGMVAGYPLASTPTIPATSDQTSQEAEAWLCRPIRAD